MQQLKPVPDQQALEGVRIGVIAEQNSAIVAIEAALRAAGASIQRIPPANTRWPMNGFYDIFLMLLPPREGLGDSRYESSLGLLASLVMHQRVIALISEPLPRSVPGLRDFVLEPFRPAEVIARIAHALEDPRPEAELRAGDLHLDASTRRVTVGERTIDITFYEFEILHVLLEANGAVLSRDDMMRRLAHQAPSTSRWLDIHIHRLRAKLGAIHGARIETVRGVGYRLSRSA